MKQEGVESTVSNFETEISLNQLFKGFLFRIPDYQRGYSWDVDQLDDMWDDITSLEDEQTHYTGLITLSNGDAEDRWTGYETLYVVDGQQRLATLLILLKIIISRAEGLELKEIGEIPIQTLVNKYLYLENTINREVKAPVFGYVKSDPSNEFFQTEILGIKQPKENTRTSYTNRLFYAKTYFAKKVKVFDKDQLSRLFSKVTNCLVFNKYVASSKSEVSMIFESMNNRGKPLTTLELLKNRLLYLSEKMNLSEDEKIVLREHILKCWKIIYEWLGKSDGKSRKLLADDVFLKNHWIMWFEYNRSEAKAFAEHLLKKEFTLKRVHTNELKYERIYNYIVSLADSVQCWHYMHYPEQSEYPELIKTQLGRLNRLSYKSSYTAFKPLILAILNNLSKENTETEVARLVLSECEEYVFKIFLISDRLSNKGDSHFYKLANQYYKHEKTLNSVLKFITTKLDEYYKLENFYDMINDYFSDDNGKGFYWWDGINYFLFEYDRYLQEQSKGTSKEINWKTYRNPSEGKVSIEHIYPQKDSKDCWVTIFAKFSPDEKRRLKGSLGNLLPLSIPRNSSFQNNCFSEKKNDGDGCGYYNGSYSETEVSNIEEWNADEIQKRGFEMLKFMEKRWNMIIDDKIRLLGLKFLENGKSNLKISIPEDNQ